LAVVAIVCWFLWVRRNAIRAAAIQSRWSQLPVVVPIGLASLAAYAVDVRVAQLAVFVASVLALAWAILGRDALRTFAYPVGVLVLALPIWNLLRPTLQALTVKVSALVLGAIGVPVFVDETYIYIPERTVVVLTDCSGVQYFQAALTLAAVHSYLNFRSFKARAAIMLLFVGASLVGNWIRVLILISSGNLNAAQHWSVGWGIFALLLIPLFALSARLEKGDTHVPRLQPSLAPKPQRPLTVLGVSVAATALLIAGPLMRLSDTRTHAETQFRLAGVAPEGDWSGPIAAHGDWKPVFLGSDAEISAAYANQQAERVDLYVAFYATQRQGHEAINESNSLFERDTWAIDGDDATPNAISVPVNSDRPLLVVESRLRNKETARERITWHWYEIAGMEVTDPTFAKVAQLVGRLRGRTDAAAFVLSMESQNREESRATLSNFLVAHYAALKQALALANQ
jgi:EpsI family protein